MRRDVEILAIISSQQHSRQPAAPPASQAEEDKTDELRHRKHLLVREGGYPHQPLLLLNTTMPPDDGSNNSCCADGGNDDNSAHCCVDGIGDDEALANRLRVEVYRCLLQLCGGEEEEGEEGEGKGKGGGGAGAGDPRGDQAAAAAASSSQRRSSSWHSLLERAANDSVLVVRRRGGNSKGTSNSNDPGANFNHQNRNRKRSSAATAAAALRQEKPWDFEIRVAPALFGRFRGRNGDRDGNKAVAKAAAAGTWEIRSDRGLARQIASPGQFGSLLRIALEERIASEGEGGEGDENSAPATLSSSFHRDVRCCPSSGFVYVYTPGRVEHLREIEGKLPCPLCPKWLKGEKGMWWHVQNCHSQSYSQAVDAAETQGNYYGVGAIVPYSGNPWRHLANHLQRPPPVGLRSNSNLNPAGTGSPQKAQHNDDDDGNNDPDPWRWVKAGNLRALRAFVEEACEEEKKEEEEEEEERPEQQKRKAGKGQETKRPSRWDPATARDGNGASALLWAAGGGHLDLTRYLVERCGCRDVDEPQLGRRGFAGRTALHWACRNGHLDVARYLVDECGANVEAKTSDGTTAFGWAAWQGHLPILRYLHQCGCDVNAVNGFGCNAVLWASQGTGGGKRNNNSKNGEDSGGRDYDANNDDDDDSFVEIFEWFKSVGCNLHQINSNGHGVLHKAAQRGRHGLCRWFVELIMSDVEKEKKIETKETKTECSRINAASTASNRGDYYFLRDRVDDPFPFYNDPLPLLLEHVRPDSDGCTPSDLAGMEGQERLALFLAAREAELVRLRITMSSSSSWRPPSWWDLAETSEPDLVWEAKAGVRRMRAAAAEAFLAEQQQEQQQQQPPN